MEPILSKLLNSLSRFSSEFLVVSHAEQFKSGSESQGPSPRWLLGCSEGQELQRG